MVCSSQKCQASKQHKVLIGFSSCAITSSTFIFPLFCWNVSNLTSSTVVRTTRISLFHTPLLYFPNLSNGVFQERLVHPKTQFNTFTHEGCPVQPHSNLLATEQFQLETLAFKDYSKHRFCTFSSQISPPLVINHMPTFQLYRP